MVLPERLPIPLQLMGIWLNMCVVDMVTQSHFNSWNDTDWCLGLVFNAHILPMTEHGEIHILQGLNMANNPFMHVSLWPFVHNHTCITPPKLAQVGVH